MKLNTSCIIFTLVLLFSESIYSQGNNASYQKGEEIVRRAHTAIFVVTTPKEVDSINVKRNGSSFTQTKFQIQISGKLETRSNVSESEQIERILIVLPNKIRIGTSMKEASKFDSGRKRQVDTESLMISDGSRASHRIDIYKNNKLINTTSIKSTDEVLPQSLKDEIGEVRKNRDKQITSNVVMEEVWEEIFPIFLGTVLFKDDLKFKFVGIAESPTRKANIIDVENATKPTRLFFDTETSLLLMMEVDLLRGNIGEKHKILFFRLCDNRGSDSCEKNKNRTDILQEVSQRQTVGFQYTNV